MGQTGLKLSEIALGGWLTYGGSEALENSKLCVSTAIDAGVNFIDLADGYSAGNAERVIGQIIKDYNRSDLVISSKVFWPTMDGENGKGLSRKHIMESCEASLERMGLDYLDLYFCHRFDPETPVEEVVRAMDDLVHQGKILYWGTSEWRASQIGDAYRIARQWGLYPPYV